MAYHCLSCHWLSDSGGDSGPRQSLTSHCHNVCIMSALPVRPDAIAG